MVNYKTVYKTMFKDAPVAWKHGIEELAKYAYVKYVEQNTIYAYSPIFKDIAIYTNNGTLGCKRGDEIEIKFSERGVNHFDLVRNLTLDDEVITYFQRSFQGAFPFDDNVSITIFRSWRDEQLKNQKQR